ncbi:MAG: hypothetical protein IPL20_11010 [Saprospiraceae bacterium]|nr:hypothetical protein [Saprospiraceae bacterium]
MSPSTRQRDGTISNAFKRSAACHFSKKLPVLSAIGTVLRCDVKHLVGTPAS